MGRTGNKRGVPKRVRRDPGGSACEDNQVLMREPLRSVGSITALFRDDLSVAQEIMKVAEDFRKNSEVTA